MPEKTGDLTSSMRVSRKLHSNVMFPKQRMNTLKQTKQIWNMLLADFFCELPLWRMNQPIEKNGSKYTYQPNRRKIAELTYHLTEAGEWETLKDTLCNLSFIEAKCLAGMTVDLLNDYETAQKKNDW